MSREKNLYQRSGVWWLRAAVNGAEHRESLHTRDVRNARALRDKRLEEIAAARWHGRERITWKAAVAAWARHEAGQIAPSTTKRYAVSLLQCEAFLEAYNIDRIDGRVIGSLITARRAAGTTPATIRRDLTAISRVLAYAEGMEWREGNPTLSKRKFLRERRDPIVLPEQAAIETMIAACPPRFGALIRAAWLTGCRQDELVKATWRAFNPRGKTLDVIGKGNKRRTIALSPDASAHFSAQPRAPGSDLIFCRENGAAFAEAAYDFTHFRRKLD